MLVGVTATTAQAPASDGAGATKQAQAIAAESAAPLVAAPTAPVQAGQAPRASAPAFPSEEESEERFLENDEPPAPQGLRLKTPTRTQTPRDRRTALAGEAEAVTAEPAPTVLKSVNKKTAASAKTAVEEEEDDEATAPKAKKKKKKKGGREPAYCAPVLK